MAERKAKYNRAADQRWEAANREHRKYLSHRSRARSFIREAATLEDLQELKKLIEEREKNMGLG